MKTETAFQTVLNAVKNRKGGYGYGVTTADRYVAPIIGSSEPQVFKRFANAGGDSVLKDSQNKLVYCNQDMILGNEKFANGGWKSSLPAPVYEKFEQEIKGNVAMVFKNIVTTNREDRDRDVLHTAGAEPDLKMPFLWQHIHTLPLGKMLMIDEHTEKWLKVWTVLFDMNELTNDAAILIENDALRISHGFLPKQISEREWKKNDDDERMPGFNIHKFVIMEESGVSVPSNTDAVIELWSRDKLKSMPAKSWGKSLFDNREKIWTGWSAPASEKALLKGLEVVGRFVTELADKSHDDVIETFNSDEDNNANEKANTGESQQVDESQVDKNIDDGSVIVKNSSGTKSRRKGVYVEMKGSFEWVRARLGQQLKEHFGTMSLSEDFSAYIEGTFADYVIAEHYCWETSCRTYWKLEFKIDDEGEPKFSGIPAEVSIESTVAPKSKEDEMKITDQQRVSLKNFGRFLDSIKSKLSADDVKEIDIHCEAFDSLLESNKQPKVFKQSEGGTGENPGEGGDEENPGVDEGRTDPKTQTETEPKNVEPSFKDVSAFLASNELNDEQKSILKSMLA